ncbi:MAG: pitrilysin family protein [Propionibacteriaceae bacterium]|nr:pitrilysin family protein [Propionibacteriaceae bacterium]
MTRPAIADPSPWDFPLPTSSRLGNGLTLTLFDLPGQHLAAVELVLPTPVAAEPRDREGVATVALLSSDEATSSRPDVVELLELEGAAVGGTTFWNHSRLGLSAPVSRLRQAMPLFASITQEPSFEPADVAHHVEAQVAAFETRLASPTAVTQQAMQAALYGVQQREGRPLAGIPDTLRAIDRQAVQAWHAQTWRPEGAELIVAGDLAGEPAELVESFAAWQGTVPAAPVEASPQPPRFLLVDQPHAAQTIIQVSAPTPGRRDPRWAALKLGGHVMCGAFASRLNLELRERLGYTYGVSGGVSARQAGGVFRAGMAVENAAAPDAVARTLAALALPQPFTQDEVADAARYLVRVAPLSYETAADIARQAAVLAVAGLHPQFVNQHRAALATTDAEQVNAAWAEVISPEKVTVVVGGPAAQLQPALEPLGFGLFQLPW